MPETLRGWDGSSDWNEGNWDGGSYNDDKYYQQHPDTLPDYGSYDQDPEYDPYGPPDYGQPHGLPDYDPNAQSDYQPDYEPHVHNQSHDGTISSSSSSSRSDSDDDSILAELSEETPAVYLTKPKKRNNIYGSYSVSEGGVSSSQELNPVYPERNTALQVRDDSDDEGEEPKPRRDGGCCARFFCVLIGLGLVGGLCFGLYETGLAVYEKRVHIARKGTAGWEFPAIFSGVYVFIALVGMACCKRPSIPNAIADAQRVLATFHVLFSMAWCGAMGFLLHESKQELIGAPNKTGVADYDTVMDYLLWLHYVSKYVNCAHTLAFLIRAKKVTFMHVYRHVLVIWAWWFTCQEYSGGDIWFFAATRAVAQILLAFLPFQKTILGLQFVAAAGYAIACWQLESIPLEVCFIHMGISLKMLVYMIVLLKFGGSSGSSKKAISKKKVQ